MKDGNNEITYVQRLWVNPKWFENCQPNSAYTQLVITLFHAN